MKPVVLKKGYTLCSEDLYCLFKYEKSFTLFTLFESLADHISWKMTFDIPNISSFYEEMLDNNFQNKMKYKYIELFPMITRTIEY